MKTSFIILALTILLSSCASKATFSTFYKENKQASEFSLKSPAFIAKMFLSKEDLKGFRPLVKRVKHLKILVFEDDNSIDKNFKKFIKKQDYETLFRIADKETNIQLFLSNAKNQKKEIILKVKDEESYILISLTTNMSAADLDEILRNINFKPNEVSYTIN